MPFVYKKELVRLIAIIVEKYNLDEEYEKCTHLKTYTEFMKEYIDKLANTGVDYMIKRDLGNGEYEIVSLKNGFTY